MNWGRRKRARSSHKGGTSQHTFKPHRPIALLQAALPRSIITTPLQPPECPSHHLVGYNFLASRSHDHRIRLGVAHQETPNSDLIRTAQRCLTALWAGNRAVKVNLCIVWYGKICTYLTSELILVGPSCLPSHGIIRCQFDVSVAFGDREVVQSRT